MPTSEAAEQGKAAVEDGGDLEGVPQWLYMVPSNAVAVGEVDEQG